MAETDNIHVGTVRKNRTANILVHWQKYADGSRFLDIRLFSIDAEGQLQSTGKGISIRAALLEQLLDVLEKAEEMALEKGFVSQPPKAKTG